MAPYTDDKPLYNIGMVARLTGIPVATLRVWERRYGFPQPQRTPGGHRLCSEQDVIRLRWVKQRLDEGMQTRQAIRSLQHLEEQGRLLPTPPPVNDEPASPSLAIFQRRLTAMLLAADVGGADRLLSDVMSVFSVEELILDVMAPALSAIGQAWLDGEINVAQEHLATHYLRYHLMHWMMSGPPPYAGIPATLLACAPDERHEGSLLMLGALLRRRRWPVAYLGQGTPLADVAALARQVGAAAVVWVAVQEPGARSLLGWQEHLPEALSHGRPIVGFGGRIFNTQPEWRERIAGVFLGETVQDGLARLDGLLRDRYSPLG